VIFNDVLEIKNGRNQKLVENSNGKYPIYGSGGIMGYADDYICEADTVIIGRKGSINNPIYVDEPFWNVDTAFGLCAKKDILIPRYLYYFCRHFNFERLNKAVTIPSLTKSDLLKIEIKIPKIDEQRNVVDRLLKVEQIIRMRKKELCELNELIKARFVEMFDLSECVYGTFGKDTDFVDYRGKTPELSDVGTIRMVNAKSVGKGVFKTVNEYVTDEVYEKWMHRGLGYPGDILFVTEGHTFGNTCLVPDYLKKFALGQRVITIKGHSEVIDNAFLGTYMQMEQFKQDIDVYKTGGTAQGIRSKDLLKIRLPLPKYKEQKEFADFIKQVDKSKVAVQKSLDETQLLFDSLMQKYFG
jgi:type I restriction enzyme S subunit